MTAADGTEPRRRLNESDEIEPFPVSPALKLRADCAGHPAAPDDFQRIDAYLFETIAATDRWLAQQPQVTTCLLHKAACRITATHDPQAPAHQALQTGAGSAARGIPDRSRRGRTLDATQNCMPSPRP